MIVSMLMKQKLELIMELKIVMKTKDTASSFNTLSRCNGEALHQRGNGKHVGNEFVPTILGSLVEASSTHNASVHAI